MNIKCVDCMEAVLKSTGVDFTVHELHEYSEGYLSGCRAKISITGATAAELALKVKQLPNAVYMDSFGIDPDEKGDGCTYLWAFEYHHYPEGGIEDDNFTPYALNVLVAPNGGVHMTCASEEL